MHVLSFGEGLLLCLLFVYCIVLPRTLSNVRVCECVFFCVRATHTTKTTQRETSRTKTPKKCVCISLGIVQVQQQTSSTTIARTHTHTEKWIRPPKYFCMYIIPENTQQPNTHTIKRKQHPHRDTDTQSAPHSTHTPDLFVLFVL